LRNNLNWDFASLLLKILDDVALKSLSRLFQKALITNPFSDSEGYTGDSRDILTVGKIFTSEKCVIIGRVRYNETSTRHR
jgi:hypothetical protein